MARAKHKKLAIFDLDNTLTDTMAVWSDATWLALDVLARRVGITDEDGLNDLYDAVRSSPAQYRFGDFGAVAHWLDQQGFLPPVTGAQARYERERAISDTRLLWFKQQKGTTIFYPGALESLQQIKAQGGAVAIYTDAEASSLIRRFWMLCYNAAGRDAVKAGALLDLVDHFYCMPSVEDDGAVLRDVDLPFTLKMKRNMSIWSDQTWKPSPFHAQTILSDFGVRPAQAVFSGDNRKDGGSARPAGIDFLWCAYGAEASAETIELGRRIGSPGYSYGVAQIRSEFNETNGPTHIAQKDLREMFGFFKFGKGAAFIPTELRGRTATPDPNARMSGDPAAQNPDVPAVRLSPLFHTQSRSGTLGPASDIHTKHPHTPRPDPSGKADRQTPTPPRQDL